MEAQGLVRTVTEVVQSQSGSLAVAGTARLGGNLTFIAVTFDREPGAKIAGEVQRVQQFRSLKT